MILNVKNLTHGFGDRAIFDNVSFRLLKGEHIGLIGANGEGKSTFMNIITGNLTPDEGTVEWAKNVRVGYLDQHSVLEKGMTIGDVLRSAFQFLFAMEAEIGGFINLVQNIIVKVIWMHFYVGMCYMFLTTMYPKAYSFVFENTYVDSVLKYFGKYIEQLFTYIISK